jgi:hypothetical protein
MKPNRRQFLIGSTASASFIAVGGLSSDPIGLPRRLRAAPFPREYCVAPSEVDALVARLELETGAPVWTEGDQLFLRTSDGSEAVRLRLKV